MPLRLTWIFALLTLVLVSLAPLPMVAAGVDQVHSTDCCLGDTKHGQGLAEPCPHALASSAWLSVTAPNFEAQPTPALSSDVQQRAVIPPSQPAATDPPPPRR